MAGHISKFTCSSILSFKKLFIRNDKIYIFGKESNLHLLIQLQLSDIISFEINMKTTLRLSCPNQMFYRVCNHLECGKIFYMYPDFVFAIKNAPYDNTLINIERNSLIAGEVLFTNGTFEFLLIRGIVLLGKSTRFQYAILAQISRRNNPFEFRLVILKRNNPIDEDFLTKIKDIARKNQLNTNYCEYSENRDVLKDFNENNFSKYGVEIIFSIRITENEIGNNFTFNLNLIDPQTGKQFNVPIIIESRFVQSVYDEWLHHTLNFIMTDRVYAGNLWPIIWLAS